MKQKSAERVANWTDTLESKRKQKLQWKAETLAKEEAKRQEIDRQEEKLRNNLNEQTIARAKSLQYEQNEKVRYLRSQQLYTNVVETRQDQMMERKEKDVQRRDEERQWHELSMKKLKHDEESERKKQEVKKKKAMENAALMKEQKLEVERRNQMLHRKQRAEEEALIQQVQKEKMLASEEIKRRKAQARQNAKLGMEKLSLEAHAKVELERRTALEDEQKRDAEVARITYIARTRADLELKHFEERQAARKLLADRASVDLQQRAAREVELFIRDQKAIDAKDRARKVEEARKAKEREEVVLETRREQLAYKQKQKIKEREQDAIFARKCRQQCAREKERERERDMKRQQRNQELRKFQEEQIKSTQQKRILEKENALRQAREVQENLAKEDDIFRDFAMKEMARFQAEGKKTDLLTKVVTI